ncbi:MAG: hypothetical protein FWH20_08210 [Oscillospiraceae bacterium]|nr:hypothetical protein [Oscillospiraceae bacterium]
MDNANRLAKALSLPVKRNTSQTNKLVETSLLLELDTAFNMHNANQLDKVLSFFDETQDVSNKEILQTEFVRRFGAVRKSSRGIFDLPDKSVSVRFTQNNKTADGNASNTVLAIREIHLRDEHPILSVLVTSGKNYVRIMNSSFISKISHSNKNASDNKLRGSVNYPNIIRNFDGIENESQNIPKLFELHSEHNFWENYERIYGFTSQIQGKKDKFLPSPEQTNNLMNSPGRSYQFVKSDSFRVLADDLKRRVERNSKAIVRAGFISNAKLRGEIIEHLITSDDATKLSEISLCLANKCVPDVTNPHGLADYERVFENTRIGIDIKTKVMYLDSQPKGFSIDNILLYLSESDTVFLFYWVGIEKDGTLKLHLLPVFESKMLKNSRIQKHWSGINQRGHIQFDGKMIKEILDDSDYSVAHISENDAKQMIENWIGL